MELFGIFLGKVISQALLCNHVNKDRAIKVLSVLESYDQVIDAMPGYGTYIGEAKFLEQYPRNDQAFCELLESPPRFGKHIPGKGDRFEETFQSLSETRVEFTGHNPVQICGESTNVLRDRPLIIVQNNDNIFF